MTIVENPGLFTHHNWRGVARPLGPMETLGQTGVTSWPRRHSVEPKVLWLSGLQRPSAGPTRRGDIYQAGGPGEDSSPETGANPQLRDAVGDRPFPRRDHRPVHSRLRSHGGQAREARTAPVGPGRRRGLCGQRCRLVSPGDASGVPGGFSASGAWAAGPLRSSAGPSPGRDWRIFRRVGTSQ
jgi:hypothetical protein